MPDDTKKDPPHLNVLKMQRTVDGKVVDTHSIYENDWAERSADLQRDGWSLVQ